MNNAAGTRWHNITEHARGLGFTSIVEISDKAWDEVVELWGDPEPGMEDEDARIHRLLARVLESTTGRNGKEPIHIAVQNPVGGVLTPLVLRKWINKYGHTRITINSHYDD